MHKDRQAIDSRPAFPWALDEIHIWVIMRTAIWDVLQMQSIKLKAQMHRYINGSHVGIWVLNGLHVGILAGFLENNLCYSDRAVWTCESHPSHIEGMRLDTGMLLPVPHPERELYSQERSRLELHGLLHWWPVQLPRQGIIPRYIHEARRRPRPLGRYNIQLKNCLK